MAELLWKQFPPVGPMKEDPLAITMRCDYSYDDTAQHVPAQLRDGKGVPTHLKKHDQFHLFEGDEGYLYTRDPKSVWGAAIFVRAGIRVHVIVPISHLIIGTAFRPLAEQLASPPEVGPDQLALGIKEADEMDCRLQEYIRALLSELSTSPDEIVRLGLPSNHYNALLSNNRVNSHARAIMQGFLPEVRNTLQHGNFDITDLLKLSRVTPDWPNSGHSIYIRLYTHCDHLHEDVNNAAIYIGQTRVTPWARHLQHNASMLDDEHHYRQARRAPEHHRHMIPLMWWEQHFAVKLGDGFLDLAEQVAISLFSSYAKFIDAQGVRTSFSNVSQEVLTRQSQWMINATNRVRGQVGWNSWPTSQIRGCNITSPLFFLKRRLQFLCIKMKFQHDTQRSFTAYRQRSLIFYASGIPKVLLSYVGTDGKMAAMHLFLNPRCFAHDPKAGYIVFEIMDDERPHPRPWLGCPSVGPYKNFDRASSLGIRFEWYDNEKSMWFSAPLTVKQILRGYTEEGYGAVLRQWRRAMTIIQLLEGIIWTGKLHDLPNNTQLHQTVIELQPDHLKQTCRQIARSPKTSPAPDLASWNHNFRLMHREFGHGATLVGIEPPPFDDQFWAVTGEDSRRMKRSQETPCDLCNYSGIRGYPCKRDESRTDVWVCVNCSTLNRPCTFTPKTISLELWGSERPFLQNMHEGTTQSWSLFPTGPHKHMAFYRAITDEVTGNPVQVDVPIEETLGAGWDVMGTEWKLDETALAANLAASEQSIDEIQA